MFGWACASDFEELLDLASTIDPEAAVLLESVAIEIEVAEWSLELSSGMERFTSPLAIRIRLMNVSNLPQGNFLAIDEGWGTMDSDNLNSVAQLFQYLKSQFQFTFVVSHIETMRDFVDTLLEIKKVDGSSSVRFSR